MTGILHDDPAPRGAYGCPIAMIVRLFKIRRFAIGYVVDQQERE